MPRLVPESDSDIDSDIPALTPKLDDDSDTSDFNDMFKVFAAEKKKHTCKPSRLPEAALQKTASSSQQTSPQKSMPSAAPQSTTQVDSLKPSSQIRPRSPAPTDLPKSATSIDLPRPPSQTRPRSPVPTDPSKLAVPIDPHKPAPQYRYQSNAEDQCLINNLVAWLWQGNLSQITPAHLYAASPAVRKEIAECLRVR